MSLISIWKFSFSKIVCQNIVKLKITIVKLIYQNLKHKLNILENILLFGQIIPEKQKKNEIK